MAAFTGAFYALGYFSPFAGTDELGRAFRGLCSLTAMAATLLMCFSRDAKGKAGHLLACGLVQVAMMVLVMLQAQAMYASPEFRPPRYPMELHWSLVLALATVPMLALTVMMLPGIASVCDLRWLLVAFYVANVGVALGQCTLWYLGWKDGYWMLSIGNTGNFHQDGHGGYLTDWVRASGLTRGPNALGAVTAMLWPLCGPWGPATAVLMALLTGSRALLLAIAIQFIAIGALHTLSRPRPRFGLVIAAIGFGLVAFLVFYGFPGRPALSANQDIRLSIYSFAAGQAGRCWLAGLPPGVVDNEFNLSSVHLGTFGQSVGLHSTVLDFLVNHGLLGAVLIAVCSGVRIRRAALLVLRGKQKLIRLTAIGIVGGIVSCSTEAQAISLTVIGVMMAVGVLFVVLSWRLNPGPPIQFWMLVLPGVMLWVILRSFVPAPDPLGTWKTLWEQSLLNEHQGRLPEGIIVISIRSPRAGTDAPTVWEMTPGQDWVRSVRPTPMVPSPNEDPSALVRNLATRTWTEPGAVAHGMLAWAPRQIADLQSLSGNTDVPHLKVNIPPRRVSPGIGNVEVLVSTSGPLGTSILFAGSGHSGSYSAVLLFPADAEERCVAETGKMASDLSARLSALALRIPD